MRFASPIFLILILGLVALYIEDRYRYRKKTASIGFSNIEFLSGINTSFGLYSTHILLILRLVVILFLILALARPQSGRTSEEITTQGRDIILALDISGSMRAEDFKPENRLGAAKEVVRQFIHSRKADRLGLVVFSRYSFTQCPLTLDYGVLINLLEEIHIGMIEDGTAIGEAISTCINRLKDSEAKTKIIILLTDGINNSGAIDPITAAQMAKVMGIKIYTIGTGVPGAALYPVDDPILGKRYVRMNTEIDEDTLNKIAEMTGGFYFRAKDEKGLKMIYDKIGRLEKTEIKSTQYIEYNEKANYFILPALILLLGEIVLSSTVLRRLP